MKKAYLPKPVSCVKEGPAAKVLNNSDDFDAILDDAMLDDEDDDLICSQFNLADIPGIEILKPVAKQVQPVSVKPAQFRPPPVTPQQSRHVTAQSLASPSPYQPRPMISPYQSRNLLATSSIYRPQTPVAASTPVPIRPQQPGLVNSRINGEDSDQPSNAKFNQLLGENIMLKEKLEIAKKQLDEERGAKQRLDEEKEAALTELKNESDKKLNNIQSKLEFKEYEYSQLKMKINELERQLKNNQDQLDNHQMTRPLPYSLPIVMHRSLDFTPNKGFVDWDESAALNDVPF